ELDAFAFGQGVAPIAARKEAGTNTSPFGAANSKSQIAERSPTAALDQFAWVDRLGATNPATAIGDALREVRNRKRGQPLAGILLVTDGANNSGSPPREIAGLLREEGVPLYVYGVGITSPRDIIIGNLFAPDVTF